MRATPQEATSAATAVDAAVISTAQQEQRGTLSAQASQDSRVNPDDPSIFYAASDDGDSQMPPSDPVADQKSAQSSRNEANSDAETDASVAHALRSAQKATSSVADAATGLQEMGEISKSNPNIPHAIRFYEHAVSACIDAANSANAATEAATDASESERNMRLAAKHGVCHNGIDDSRSRLANAVETASNAAKQAEDSRMVVDVCVLVIRSAASRASDSHPDRARNGGRRTVRAAQRVQDRKLHRKSNRTVSKGLLSRLRDFFWRP